MSRIIVVDTDIVSLIFRQDSRAAFYREEIDGKHCFLSFMTVAELDRWALRFDWGIQRRLRLEDFLVSFAVYESDRSLCQRWAEVSELGRQAGRPIHCADAWIAATALELDCPLVTHNAKDYRMIPNLDIRTASGN